MKHKIKQAFFIGFLLFFLISCNKTAQENENELVIYYQKDNEESFISAVATIIDENKSIELVNFWKDTVTAKTTYFYNSNSKLDSIIRVNFYKNKTDGSMKYQYFYDNDNRLKKETYFWDFYDETFTTTYFYNSNNQLIELKNEETNKENNFMNYPDIKKYGSVINHLKCLSLQSKTCFINKLFIVPIVVVQTCKKTAKLPMEHSVGIVKDVKSIFG